MIKRILLCSIYFLVSIACGAYASERKLPLQDTEYLKGIYQSTFDGILFFTEPKTGLPYDVSDFRRATSISNIGLYIGVVSIGFRTKLIEREEAVIKIDAALKSLEQIKKWRGFPITWVGVSSLKQEYGPGFSYADHVGNLLCGLIAASDIFPKEFRKRIDDFISPMDFGSTYDSSTGWLKGGYNTQKEAFDVRQPWGKWYYNLLASDTRHFSLFAITLGNVPETHWEKLIRDTAPWGELDKEILAAINAQVCPYYAPGIEGGGMFMQFLPAIFLDEKKLPMEKSAMNFARCQIDLAIRNRQFPFWGISACESPDAKSYIGWGKLKKNIISPHASVLAIGFFPKETVENLKNLQAAGARPAYFDSKSGKEYDFGFTDSFDTASGQASKHYLALDQSMLFLSLANYLNKDIVRKSFNHHPLGRKINKTMRRLEKKYGDTKRLGL